MDYAYNVAVSQAKALLVSSLNASGFSVKEDEIKVEPSKTADADLSCTIAFVLARKAGKAPKDIAEQVAKSASEAIAANPQKSAYISKAVAANGYVNFILSDGFFSQAAAGAVGPKNYGSFSDFSGKTAIVEYSSPNVGKPMHIGHIRSTILGDSVANLFDAAGYKVVRMNYLCEAGAQVAGLLLALETFGSDDLKDEKDLLKYYVEITKQIEADPALKAREQEIISLMESGDPAIASNLDVVRRLTIAPFDENYVRLGIRFDESVFDSAYVAPGKELVAEAQRKGLAKKDEKGEVVGLLEGKSNLPNLIILRSNGSTLYSTRDMGFAQWRWDKYAFDKSIVVTASEQNTHFRQVFKLLELLGRDYTPRLSHIGFGLVFLEGGVKLSSRKGNVLLLEDVLDDAEQIALEQIKDRGYPPEEAKKIAFAVGVGAVKFAILRVSSEKNINFSMQKAVSFEGDTGAYLQYTVVRAKNILRKAGYDATATGIATSAKTTAANSIAVPSAASLSKDERELAKFIAQYPPAVRSAAVSMAPHQVCDYALKVAAAFSTFYSSSPVLEAESEEKRQLRLVLVAATVSTLESALALLGINVPDKM
ncbi:MAG: arginine--tRNA ligase [Candidatus Micrarchaeia archaeon]